MSVQEVDYLAISDRIILMITTDTKIFNESGTDNKILNVFFGIPTNENWARPRKPYICVSFGEPLEVEDEFFSVVGVGKKSPSNKHLLQYFITLVTREHNHVTSMKRLAEFQKLLKEIFKNNPKLTKPSNSTDPKCIRTKSTVTNRLFRNKGEPLSGFTLILRCEILTN